MDKHEQEVYVTGGNGWIASCIIRALLEKGYVVRSTVRNPGRLRLSRHLNLPVLGLNWFKSLV